MRKELVWAGVIGIAFGLVIAFGAWRINSSLKPKGAKTQASPAPNVVSEFKIALAKPENNDVVTEDSITVSGITKAGSWLTISGESDDYIIQADQKGVFEQDVNLTSGVNQIKLTAFDPKGNQSIEKVLVVYSSAFQKKTVPSPTGDASSESTIREKVAEKVAEALNKPKAYIGVVTDIADSTIQIKTLESEIKQISIAGDGITVVNSKGTSTKAVKLTDIAIGDFIVAMGYVNSNSVLSAQRILITQPVEEPKISAFYGKVTDSSSKSLTLAALKDGRETVVTPGAKTNIFSYKDGKVTRIKLTVINEGDLIIFVSDQSSDTPKIRTIFMVQ